LHYRFRRAPIIKNKYTKILKHAIGKKIVKELKICERSKVSLDVKVLGITTYIQALLVRRRVKILSDIHPVSKSSVHR